MGECASRGQGKGWAYVDEVPGRRIVFGTATRVVVFVAHRDAAARGRQRQVTGVESGSVNMISCQVQFAMVRAVCKRFFFVFCCVFFLFFFCFVE